MAKKLKIVLTIWKLIFAWPFSYNSLLHLLWCWKHSSNHPNLQVKNKPQVRAPTPHVGAHTSEREPDGGVGVQYRWKERGKKLRVIVPAQCTQLSIVQVLRASAITAQLMPVAWLRLQLRITTLGLEQGGEKRKRADNWIPAVSVRKTWRRKEERRRKAKNRRDDTVSIYVISQRPRFSP